MPPMGAKGAGFAVKRIYDPPADDDGYRVLVAISPLTRTDLKRCCPGPGSWRQAARVVP
ncbi:hypothetical protein ABIC98_001830 [Arthrobacter nitrophenolicus]|uniref:Uncharacterized protein n=1 Tax=Arthrobacter nitrophenolicus TaxID=683150 RepID=A0ACC6TEU7_9MICC